MTEHRIRPAIVGMPKLRHKNDEPGDEAGLVLRIKIRPSMPD